MKPDEWCVIYNNANLVGIDGFDGLNPNGGPKRQTRAVFSSAQEAHDYADARAAANPETTFQVVKLS